MKILIADDDKNLRMVLTSELSEGGFDVDTAECGIEAMDLLEKNEYDVLLLDLAMPGLGGIDVLKKIKTLELPTEVVILTGNATVSSAVEAMKLGAYDYLSKEHIEIDRLPLIINSVFERYLYRKEVLRREREELQMRTQQKDLASLQMFQNTVSSIGQFVNNSLAGLSKRISETENALSPYVPNDGRKTFVDSFAALKQEFDVAFSGLKSMLDLTTLVTQKLEGIQKPQSTDQSKP